MSVRRTGCIFVPVALTVAALAGWLLRAPLLTKAATILIEDDGAQKEQAAFVLGGDNFGTRIVKAAELAQAGHVPYVVVSGPEAFGRHECDFTIPYAEGKGFAGSLFQAAPNDADSTRTEARFLGRYFKERGVSRILLVTSNYHTRRAAYLVRKENPGMQVDVVPAPDPFFTPDGWWKTRSGQKVFLLEWTKTIASWLGA